MIQALKGKLGSSYRHERDAGSITTCDRTFVEGEVAVVFVAKQRVGICSGNHALERGMLTLVSGRYPTEGYHFDVLLENGKQGFEVINLWGRETKKK